MPRSKGARLYLRPATNNIDGSIRNNATWVIRDGRRFISTGCRAHSHSEAERKLQEYLATKYALVRKERDIAQIMIIDVLEVYQRDVVPGSANPTKVMERIERLIEFFGDYTLDHINGFLCREYVKWRQGKGHARKGTGGGARRDLEDLRSAINHHAKEGYHRGVVRVVLPERGKARQRWLNRAEAAKLLWICWSTREVQEDARTERRPLRHLCRFLIMGLYTGSRPGVLLTAAWDRGPGRSWVDIEGGVFYRHAEGKAETNKRQPAVKLSQRLLAHLRRWKEMDGGCGYVVTFNGARIVTSPKTALSRAARLAGLAEGVTAYSLRHTTATWVVAKGLSTRKVADYLGTSEGMILRHYGHLAPDFQDEAALKIGQK